MAGLGKHSPSDRASTFDPARNIRLVPPFQEKEVDQYFAHFEKVADSLNWPKESWVLLLQSVLVGKAQEIYGSLSVEQSSDYEHVKEAILKAYELVPEAYMNISRNMDDRKRQGKSAENVGLVSKVEPLKPISCGHCGKPGHIITNCWKLGGKTPCEHCGRFNHKSEDCRMAKNKLQKEVKPTGLTSLKGLKVSHFNESENQKGVKVKPLIDRNHFVEKNKGIKVNPLHNDKSCIEDEISPNTESDYMENYKPFISEAVVSLV